MITSVSSTNSSAHLNRMIRVLRIGKMYKLIKLTKLLRILKILKEKSKIAKVVKEYIKIGAGVERLVFGMVIFVVIIHIVSCLWIFLGYFDFIGSWLDNDEIDTIGGGELYLTAFYFTTTTITTVGYGDISGNTVVEKIYCIIVMMIGVISFSFASASLTSLFSDLDSSNAIFL